MTRRARLAVAAAAAMLLIAVPSARAAGPLTVGNGYSPGVAVDAAGTAYVAWYGPEPNTTTLRFCRLPRGTAACDASLQIATPGTSLSRPFVSVQGNVVRVVSYRYGLTGANFAEDWEFTSSDRGATFDAGHPVGLTPFDEAAAGPGDTLSVVTNAFSGGEVFQNLPLGGGSAGAASAVLSADHPYNGTVGLIDANTPLAVFADGSSNAQFRRYSGAGSVNDAASWTAPVDIGYADYPRLAGGPSGLFLLSGTLDNALLVRKWNGTTFTAGVRISDAGDDAQAHLTEDPAGRLHAVFGRGEADGQHLFEATSDDGVSWQSSDVLVQGGSEAYEALRAAAAADHVGVAVWETNAAAGPQIRVLPIGAAPVFHKSVVVAVISGKVRVRRPGSSTFVTLSGTDAIPLGSTVDVKAGVLGLTSVPKRNGTPQTSKFYSGIFKVTQPGGITQLALSEPLAPCHASATAAAKKKPKTRKLWGDGSGAFSTSGQYSAATVRGTKWLVQDSCAGTLTKVVRGVVSVRDSVRRKTITLKAGHSYLARPKR
jgi:hypothetical protein